MKKIFTLILTLLSVSAISQSTTVVISQAYGGGGGSTGTYLNDYVELHNISNVSQVLTGYSLQYGSSTGLFGSSASNIYAFPAGTTILAGGYLFIQVGPTGSAGAAFPVTPDIITTNLTMSATSGKVLLSNQAAAMGCGATATPCSLPNALIVDLVAYGAANNAEGGTSVNNGVALTSSQGSVRNNNGCQETDNNNSDFTVQSAPVPRNSGSPVNICGGGGSPNLGASPASLTGFLAFVGTASTSQSFNLSGSNLTPAAGNISVAPSAGWEVSTDNSTFSAVPINVGYSTGTLASTPIYVRIAASAPQGAASGNVTSSGGGAAVNAVVNLTGAVVQNYYSKSSGDLDQLGTWGTNPDGTGTVPVSFGNPYQYFNVVNQANATLGNNWDVTATGSRIIVGNGAAAVTLTVPATFAISATSPVDVTNNATLLILNNTRPLLGTLSNGSTVNYAETGLTTADTIKIQTASYFNLKLTNGIKILSSGTTTIRGTFTIDGVINFNGAPSPFSTINSQGDITLLNGSTFEPLPTGDNARITLAMNSSSTQTISGNGSSLLLFRLRRDTTTSNGNIILNPGTNLVLGNNSGGGLQLVQGLVTTTVLTVGSNSISLIGAAASTTTSLGKINISNGSIFVSKSLGATDAGTLRFSPGSTIDQFIINLGVPVTKDSVNIADNVSISGDLTLTKGKIVVASAAVLSFLSTASIAGGSATSFIDGKMSRTGNTSFSYPVGKGPEYSPMDILNPSASETFTVQYFNTAHPTTTIDPTTQALYPAYNISRKEYWTVDRAGLATADLVFYYDAFSSLVNTFDVRIAHYDGTDWNDIGGTSSATPVSGNVRVNGVSIFSPFTFGAALNVLPISITSFSAQKISNAVKLSWSTEQEINSSRFIIERSSNGRTWEVINTVNAAGNSRSKLDYFVSDYSPLSGINYYRLKSVDADGKAQYSVVRLVSISKDAAMIISPNPAKDFINVNYLSNNNGAIIVTLADANGKTIIQTKTTESIIRLDIRNVGKGTYLLYVIDGDKVSSEKVLIQ